MTAIPQSKPPTVTPTATTTPTQGPPEPQTKLLMDFLSSLAQGTHTAPAQPAGQQVGWGAMGQVAPPPPTMSGSAPPGGWSPLVSPLATQAFFQTTIAPMLKQIQETGDKDTNAALGDIASHMGGLNLPPEIAAIYANRLPRETQQYGDLSKMLTQAALTAPMYDHLMNQLAATQKQALADYNLQSYNASSSSATQSNQPPPAGAKPGGVWVNGTYIPPA